MSAQMNESLFKKKILILGIGRHVTTKYRVLPNIRYSAEPSNRTEYRFSPTLDSLNSPTSLFISELLQSRLTWERRYFSSICPCPMLQCHCIQETYLLGYY